MKDFFKNKKVFITGHTGFKGSWLSLLLLEMGAAVIGYGLETKTEKDNFVVLGLKSHVNHNIADIRDASKLKEVFEREKPDIVFHLAAQPLVRYSYKNPKETYDVNVMGTMNVLECVRSSNSVKEAIIITSDKCYENREQIWGYREGDRLGGDDLYSSSKACVEILVNSYRHSFFCDLKASQKIIATVRAGNVIGGGDWSEDRLIPDCIRAIESEKEIRIRSPKSIRPWQHVLEPLHGYLMLSKKLMETPSQYSQAWNFGPEFESIKSVWAIAELLIKEYGKGKIIDDSLADKPHEAQLLALDITKSKYELGWSPRLKVEDAIQLTVDWYKNYRTNSMMEFCLRQIKDYNHKVI